MENSVYDGTDQFHTDRVNPPATQSCPLDPVDLAAEESFPSSDPPAWTMGREKRQEFAPPAPPAKGGAKAASFGQIIDLAEARARRRAKAALRLQDPIARIYRPAPTVMQAGKARSGRWLLEFLSPTPPFIEPLMGWIGATDTRHHVTLSFNSREEAVTYAQRQNIPFFLAEPHERRPRIGSYAENFLRDQEYVCPH